MTRAVRGQRGSNYAKWVNAPLQNFIRSELDKRDWSVSDLAREIDRTPSLVSRWMQGQTPSVASLKRISQAFGVSEDTVLTLPSFQETDPIDEDAQITALVAKIRAIHWNDDRLAVIDGVLEAMRRTPLPEQRPSDSWRIPRARADSAEGQSELDFADEE